MGNFTNEHQIKANIYFEEFPWLKDYVSADRVEAIKVTRVTAETVKYCQETSSAVQDSPGYSPKWIERIVLLDSAGGYITDVGFVPKKVEKRFLFWRRQAISFSFDGYESREPISTALIRLGDKSGDVYFILSICDAGGERKSDYFNVTIYKPPKGFTLKNWAEQRCQVLRNAFHQQIAAIDEESVE